MGPTAQTLRFGRYEVLEEIGRGAMGVVFKARDPKIGRLVALKTIHLASSLDAKSKAQYLERFYREASAAGCLAHPNIVTVYDTGEEGGVPFIALELVPGQSLEAFLAPRNALPWQQAVGIILQIAEALESAHEQGIVHRDIKPANILITPNGRVKITDFGIAKITGSHLTQEALILGTPSYIAPEVILGQPADRRVDIFSVGCVAYELLSGIRPFAGEEFSTVCYRIVHEEPRSLAEVAPDTPAPLRAIVAKTLAKVPAARYPRAGDLAAAFRALLEQRDPETEDDALAQTVVSTKRNLLDHSVAADPQRAMSSDTSGAILPRLGSILIALGKRLRHEIQRWGRSRRIFRTAAVVGILLVVGGVLWAVRQADPAVQARKYLEAGELREAISVLVESRERTPKRADLALLLGEAYAQSGMRLRALSAYRQAMELDAAYRRDRDLVRRIVAMLAHGETAGEAGELLAQMGEVSLDPLQEATKSANSTLRWNAARVLRGMGQEPDYVLLYILDLKHEDCFTRRRAAERLGGLGDKRAIPGLQEARQRSILANFCMFGALDDALKQLGSR